MLGKCIFFSEKGAQDEQSFSRREKWKCKRFAQVLTDSEQRAGGSSPAPKWNHQPLPHPRRNQVLSQKLLLLFLLFLQELAHAVLQKAFVLQIKLELLVRAGKSCTDN